MKEQAKIFILKPSCIPQCQALLQWAGFSQWLRSKILKGLNLNLMEAFGCLPKNCFTLRQNLSTTFSLVLVLPREYNSAIII